MTQFRPLVTYMICILWAIHIVPGCDTDVSPEDAAPAAVAPTYRITKNIGPEGGSIRVTDPGSPLFGVRADIPEGALTKNTAISIAYVPNPQNPPTSILPTGSTIDFLPDGISFNKHVDLYLPYHDSDNDGFIDNTTTAEDAVRAMLYNDSSGLWQDITIADQDTENNLIQLRTTHFSRYSTVSYLTKVCRKTPPITYGPYYFSLFYNYSFLPNEYRTSVSDVGADLNVSNATIMDLNSAILEYDGFKDLYDRIIDATIWTWTWQVNTELTYLSRKVGLEDEDVVTSIRAKGPTTLEFSWNFDYRQMAPSEMLVVKFYGTTNTLCRLLDKTPTPPGNLYITDVTDTSVGLEWDEVVNVYGDVMYNVYVSQEGQGFDTLFTYNTNHVTISGLTPSTRYRFKVTTNYENDLESGDSNTVSTMTASGL